MKVLIDADIVAWRAAAGQDDNDLFEVSSRADFILNTLLDELEAKEYTLYLSGRDNFRYSIFPEYKAHRYNKPRPKWEAAVKQYLVDQWQAETINGIEADDALGIEQSKAKKDSTIIATIDKDLLQIAGWHYNFVKKEKYYVSPEEADRYFWYQLLVGDHTDGIKGASGIGKIKAERIIADTPLDKLYETVKDYFSCEEEMDMNAQCVYIWRKENDNWRNLIVSN
jgi:5'-3' exonuclease